FVSDVVVADQEVRRLGLAARTSGHEPVLLVSRTRLELAADLVAVNTRVVLFFIRKEERDTRGWARLDLELTPEPLDPEPGLLREPGIDLAIPFQLTDQKNGEFAASFPDGRAFMFKVSGLSDRNVEMADSAESPRTFRWVQAWP